MSQESGKAGMDAFEYRPIYSVAYPTQFTTYLSLYYRPSITHSENNIPSLPYLPTYVAKYSQAKT